MSKKESFVFYTDWITYFDMLDSNDERVELLRCINNYNVTGEVPAERDHSRVFMVIFTMMKGQFDRDTIKYQKKVEKLRENAKKSHQANATDCYQLQANATNCKQMLPIAAVTDTDTVTDTVTDTGNNIGAKTRKRFIKPTVEEVREYCRERGNTVDPDTFVNFYESKGWVVGKSPMKDWKAAVRNWERSRTETTPQEKAVGDLGNSFDTDDFWQAALADSARKRKELGG